MHLNKVVVIQFPVMVDINNSRSWRVKFYTDTGSSWTTVFPGGESNWLFCMGKRSFGIKLEKPLLNGFQSLKYVYNGQEYGWNRHLAVILNCRSNFSLKYAKTFHRTLDFSKDSCIFNPFIPGKPLQSVLANACSGSLLSPIRQWSIRLIGSIRKWRNLCKNGLQSPMA